MKAEGIHGLWHPVHLNVPKAKIPKPVKIIVFGLVGLFVLFNLAFLIYPRSKTLPTSRVANIDVSNMNKVEIVDELSRVSDNLIVTIKTDKASKDVSLEELGVTIDEAATADIALGHRDNWYFPVMSWWSVLSQDPIEPIFKVDNEKVAEATDSLVDDFGKKSASASVEVDVNGVPSVKPAVQGYSYQSDNIGKSIVSQLSLNNQTVSLEPTVTKPDISTTVAQQAVDKYNKLVGQPTNLRLFDKEEVLPASVKSDWYYFEVDEANKDIILTIDNFAVASYVSTLANGVDTPATNTVVSIVDGNETDRTEGEKGEVLNQAAATELIVASLLNGPDPAKLPSITAQPQVVYDYSYSPTNAGLAKLVNDWVGRQNADYGIVVTELGGQGRNYAYQADKPFVTASTYKMFLAYTIMKEVDNGNMELSDESGLAGWKVVWVRKLVGLKLPVWCRLLASQRLT